MQSDSIWSMREYSMICKVLKFPQYFSDKDLFLMAFILPAMEMAANRYLCTDWLGLDYKIK